MSDTIEIMSFVQLVTPSHIGSRVTGRVIAIEQYTTLEGTSTYVYVRWHDDYGKPADTTIRHELAEVEPIEGGRP